MTEQTPTPSTAPNTATAQRTTMTPDGPAYIDRRGQVTPWSKMPAWHRALVLRTWRIVDDLALTRAKMQLR